MKQVIALNAIMKLRTYIRDLPKLFWTYFASYFIVIVLPLAALSYASYSFTVSTLENELSQATIHAAKQKNASVENAVAEMQSIAIRIGLEGRITSFLNEPGNPFLLNEARDILKTAAAANQAIQSIDFYAKDKNLILASDGYTRTYTGADKDSWIPAGTDSPASGIWLSSRPGNNYDLDNIVTYVVKVPIQRAGFQALLAVHMHESVLNGLLQKLEGNQHTTTYIVDAEGNLVSSSATQHPDAGHVQALFRESLLDGTDIGYRILKQGRERDLLTYVRTLHNGWSIVTETPLQYLLSKLSYIRSVAWAAFIVLVALGVVLSYVMSRRMVSPIQLLLKKTIPYNQRSSLAGSPSSPQRNELETISHVLDHVLGKNEAWEQQFHMNLPVLRERFLLGLVNNKISSLPEMMGKLDFLHLNFSGSLYVVFLIEIDDYSLLVDSYSVTDQNLYKYAIMNIAEEIAAERYTALSAELDENQLLLLVNLDGQPLNVKTELMQLGEQMKSIIDRLLKLSVTIGIGSPYGQLTDVHYSYKEASDVIRAKIVAGTNTVLCYEDLVKEAESEFYLPPHFATHMVNFLKAGQVDEAIGSLDELYGQIKVRTKLSEEVIFRAYSQIIEDLLRSVAELHLSTEAIFGTNHNLFRELAAKETIHAIHAWICGIVRRIHDALELHQPKKNAYIDTVLAYMDANFHQDLSVEMIADQVNLNPAYLSRMFKQEVGKTLLEYLTIKRLEVSKGMLITSEMTIQEIAASIGYNNVNSFIRFFKRYEGVTPGDFRKAAR
ncbi:AraC family transcriptional regulator [Paenibacillus whitsoniae]|uniref:AraC family transcriptional regulator n=1 Tax=Paenibacillus whitsoniae TaxID=2496558 RepID=A0A430J6K6_9BACL|nr:AraC family transcriptional regulator [Paenibacillus whitsoniae]